jgi:type IV pilus assembly protein PilC
VAPKARKPRADKDSSCDAGSTTPSCAKLSIWNSGGLGTPGGEVIEGVYIADNEARLRRDFEEKGTAPLPPQPRRTAGQPAWSVICPKRQGKVAHQEFLVFNQELATLLKAGMPLVQSLDILRTRVSNATFKAVLDSVHDKVKGGAALSDAFAEHGSLFPAIYSASLLAGERSGSLEAVLRRYVGYEKVVGGVRRRTLSALIYPAILVTMMLGLVGIIVIKVVPSFSEFYANFGRQLPLSTRIIVAISNGITSNLWLLVLVVAGRRRPRHLVARPGHREQIDKAILRIQGWIGRLKFATSQAARTLATLLGGGIPLVQALDIAASAVDRFMAPSSEGPAARRRARLAMRWSGASSPTSRSR